MGKGKRQAEESLPNAQSKKQVEVNGKKKREEEEENVPMEDDSDIEFEDPYEDEYEEEDIVENEDDEEEDADEDEDGEKVSFGVMEDPDNGSDEDEDGGPKEVWKPGDALEEDEVLDYDPTTYTMLHTMGTPWPCLSFAFIPDPLGAVRTKFPHTLYLAAGTQAAEADKNSLIVMKVSRMNKTIEEDSDDDEEESDDDSDDEAATGDDPILETASFTTKSVNKVKVMPQTSQNSLMALWSDVGKVFVYDISKYITAVDNGSSTLLPKRQTEEFKIECHKNEGFALDFSPTVAGRLLSGDCTKYIYESDVIKKTTTKAYESHKASVEDVQWSPFEKDVFVSCSVDKTVKVWDARSGKAMITVEAHKSDINTLSLNKKVAYLLATGSDDCSFKIWDFRTFTKPVAEYTFHQAPICCVEWNPFDESQMVVVSDDNQVSIWDMSLEADEDEEPSEYPPQLFFIHQGQKEVKEAHWHPQIPNLICTTSADGFNMFITANSTEVAPPEKKK